MLGENQIIVVPGANARVTPAQVDNAHALIERADAVLVQMEIPLDTVEATVRLGHRLGVPDMSTPPLRRSCRSTGCNWLATSPRTSMNWRSCSAPIRTKTFAR